MVNKSLICHHVETAPKRGLTGGHGHIGWSIGLTNDVVQHVAKKLKRSIKSVAGGLSDLIEKDFLCTCLENDGNWLPVTSDISITHSGWMTYSRWDAERLEQDQGMPVEGNDDDLCGWLEWDGVDGTDYPYYNKPAFQKGT